MSAEKRCIRSFLLAVQLSFAVAQVPSGTPRLGRHVRSESSTCSLYLADKGNGPSLFAGIDFAAGQRVGSADLMFPMFDVDQTHSSAAWHEYDLRNNNPTDPRFNFESRFQSSMLEGGLANFVYCATNPDQAALIKSYPRYDYHETPRDNPMAGSRTPFRNFGYEALTDIFAGQEIRLSCPELYPFNVSSSPSCQREPDAHSDD